MMKKIFIFMLMLMSVTWASADSYDLYVAGIQVTDANKNNITGYGIESAYGWDGKVSYSPSTKTLTLENVQIKSHSDIGIRNNISGLTIWLKGRYNEVQDKWHTSKDGIVSVGNLTFDGEGMLKVGGSCGVYITPNTGDVTIGGDARVEVYAYDQPAVSTGGGSSGNLVVKGRKAMLMATTTTGKWLVSGFKSLILQDDITINKPAGVQYNTTYSGLWKDGKQVGSGTTVVIGQRIAINQTNFPNDELRRGVKEGDTDNNGYLDRDESYQLKGLYLDGQKVNDLTGVNLLWDIRDIEANGLNMKEMALYNYLLENIKLQMGQLESVNIESLKYLECLWLRGQKLTSMDLHNHAHLVGIDLEGNALTSFVPPSSKSLSYIYLGGNHLSKSAMHDIVSKLPTYDSNPEWHHFYVIDCTDRFDEQNEIDTEDRIALKAKNWTPMMTCKEKGEYVEKEYEGEKEYDLWLLGTQKVYEKSLDDIFGDGKGMSYDPTTKTLTIAKDYGSSTNGILSYIDGLTIKTDNAVTLDCGSDAIDLYGNTTFTGGSQLTLKSNIGVCIFVAEGKTLTIDGANLEMSAQMPSILGATTTGSQQLTIKDSNVKASSNSSSVAISGFPAGITLEGCAITEPVGGYVKDGDIVDKDGKWAYNVTIEKGGSAPEVFDYALNDGTTLTEAYDEELHAAVNVMLAGAQLVKQYTASTKTTTYCKPSGKKLFALAPYNEKGDMAYFLDDNVQADDAISYDYSDDMEGLTNEIWRYPYPSMSDPDDADDFIRKYSAINLGFNIPSPRHSDDIVISVKNGMTVNDLSLEQYAGLMAMWQFFGALQLTEEGGNYAYKSNDGKTLCYISKTTGEVTMAEGVTAADRVYRRILHGDREAMMAVYGMAADGTTFYYDEVLSAVRSITLTVDETPEPLDFSGIIKVSGTEVTSANCHDILGDGTASFSPETRTLTLSGTINPAPDGYAIRIGSENVSDGAQDEITIDAPDGAQVVGAIYCDRDRQLTLTGKLTVGSDHYWYGVLFWNRSSLVIKDADLTVSGNDAIGGIGDNTGFKIVNSRVELNAEERAVVGMFKDMVLENCYVSEPAAWDFNGITYYMPGTDIPVKHILILPGTKPVATGIDATGQTTADDGPTYNLGGQRIAGQPTHKGIYIRGNRKVAVK